MIKKDSNTLGVGLRVNVKLRKKKVTNIGFCFWSIWLFNHTRGHSLGI